MHISRKGSTILRDYCENSSLVGLAYISNQKIHLTERIFWLICVVISAGGSYYLIREYQNDFESKAISLVIEPAGPEDKTHFTGVGICETFSAKLNYPMLIEFMEQWKAKYKNHDNIYDIEDFLVRVIYNNMYSFGSLRDYCSVHFDCDDCVQCPMTGYKKLANLIRTNCSDLIINCVWNGKVFNCCDYFLPLHTPEGLCFIFNSEQTTKRKKTKKLDTVIGRDVGFGQLQFDVTHTIELHLLNPEDVPLYFRQALITKLLRNGANQQLQLRVESVSNDPDVHEISPNYRRCKFSNENSKNSSYKHYSFTTCVIDCIKQIQLQICGCNSIGYMIKDDDRSVVCDYNGSICLDKADFIRPQNKVMQPWLSNDFVCDCLPSCKEHEIQVVESSQNYAETDFSRIEITQTVSSQKYRRQTVRTQLDVVVTIGGILGLFLGASILSGIEILYFFLIRIFYLKVDKN